MQCISLGYWLPDAGVTFISHVLRNSQRTARCDGSVPINRAPSPFFSGFNTQDVFNSVSIGSFVFADGTVLTSSELLARGFDIEGTSGGDALSGKAANDANYGNQSKRSAA